MIDFFPLDAPLPFSDAAALLRISRSGLEALLAAGIVQETDDGPRAIERYSLERYHAFRESEPLLIAEVAPGEAAPHTEAAGYVVETMMAEVGGLTATTRMFSKTLNRETGYVGTRRLDEWFGSLSMYATLTEARLRDLADMVALLLHEDLDVHHTAVDLVRVIKDALQVWSEYNLDIRRTTPSDRVPRQTSIILLEDQDELPFGLYQVVTDRQRLWQLFIVMCEVIHELSIGVPATVSVGRGPEQTVICTFFFGSTLPGLSERVAATITPSLVAQICAQRKPVRTLTWATLLASRIGGELRLTHQAAGAALSLVLRQCDG